jgi:rhamnose utilization protein RhaD (predicted bifunctional aldolase and dehydrogenase)
LARRGAYTSLCGDVVTYRSGWELALMRWLDANAAVLAWRYEPFAVEYVASEASSKIRQYVPDFLVVWEAGQVELLEVKPSKRIKGRVIKKAEAAAEFAHDLGCTYSFVTEAELRALGALR